MSAPPSDKSGTRTASALAPPDERFWQHYSPHGELPLSSAGSLVIHVLAFGLLGLMAYLGAALFSQANRKLPVDVVRLAGGGGNPRGQGEGPNTSAAVEVGDKPNNEATAPQDLPPEDVPRPEIKVDPSQIKQPKFDDSSERKIQLPDTSNAFMNLSKRVARIRSPEENNAPSEPGYGQGGPGSGGGSGKGKGKGVGNGTGDGIGNLTKREKRNLRWSMLFNTANSADYVSQLRGLGAILAIPVREDANGCQYKIVRDLSTRPAKLLDEDINNILRMVRWIDDKPESVIGVMNVLRLPQRPSHFLAFMPEELEQKLLDLELDHLRKRHPGRKEEDIEVTKFKIIKLRNGKYLPEVYEQTVR